MMLFLKHLQYVLVICVTSVLNLHCSAVQDVEQLEHVNTKYVCQNDTITLRCPGPSLLEIQAASFGRAMSVICSNGANAHRSCDILDKKHIVKQLCDYKTQCTFEANGNNFGNDCPDVDKYLNIIYACVRSSEMEKFFQTEPPTTTPPPSTLPKTQPLTTNTTTIPSNVTTQVFNVSMNNTTPTTQPLTQPLISPYQPRIKPKVPKTKIRYFNPDGPALDFLAKAGQSAIVQEDRFTHVITLCGLGIMTSLLHELGF